MYPPRRGRRARRAVSRPGPAGVEGPGRGEQQRSAPRVGTAPARALPYSAVQRQRERHDRERARDLRRQRRGGVTGGQLDRDLPRQPPERQPRAAEVPPARTASEE